MDTEPHTVDLSPIHAHATRREMSTQRANLRELIRRLDPYLTAIALAAVVLALLELALGGSPLIRGLLYLIDLLLVADLALKLTVLGPAYRRSPWFLIDALSCLPALDILVPGIGQAVRTVRALRALRLMRMLRVLQALRMIRDEAPRTPLSPALTVSVLVVVYAALLMVADTYAVHVLPPESARVAEGFLMLGSLMGVLVTVSALRLMLPSLSDKQLRALFKVTLPRQLAQRLSADPGVYHRTQRTHATIVFCDISGFTRSVERLDGDLGAVKAHLERVMDAITAVFDRHDLIIDKFIGDAVMAFRGGELVEGDPAEHARRAVQASLEAMAVVTALDDPHFQRVKIGGASTSNAMIGAFGTSSRLSYTILGDRVNLAARLEAAVKQAGTTNLFCARTHALTADAPGLRWRRFGPLAVPGKAGHDDAYEALSADGAADWRWLSCFDDALRAYEFGDIDAAAEGFAAADAARAGGDPPSQRWLAHCRDLCGGPLPSPLPPFRVGK